jgi:hypothetical protein
MSDNDRKTALDDVDLSADLIPGQRRKLSKLSMPSGADDEQVANSAEHLGRAHGANFQVSPAAAVVPPPKPVDMVSIHIQLPDYVEEQLAVAVAKNKSSRQHIIMLGLKALGYQIEDAHLVPDRRRRGKFRN